MYSLEQIKANLNSIDRQLQVMIYEEMVENNRLLTENNRLLSQLVNENKQDAPDTDTDDLDTLKRPQLMQRMAKLSSKPQGWNRWETEDMRKHLKGVS